MPRSRIALEIGTHSPWISRLLRELGHEVIVANALKVRLIGESRKKDESSGCADAGTAGADRSPVTVSGEASQCAGASGSDDDPSSRQPGAGAHGAGQRGARTGEVVRRTLARVQRAQPESGESRRTEPGTATGAGAVAVGHRRGERTDLRVQRPDRSVGADELSAGGVAEADQGRGYADRADLSTDVGRPASLSQEPRRGLLSGTAARAQAVGEERSADAYHQRRRSLSANVVGAGSTTYLWTIRDRLWSAPL